MENIMFWKANVLLRNNILYIFEIAKKQKSVVPWYRDLRVWTWPLEEEVEGKIIIALTQAVIQAVHGGADWTVYAYQWGFWVKLPRLSTWVRILIIQN